MVKHESRVYPGTQYHYRQSLGKAFGLEGGEVLPGLTVAWCASGNPANPVVWVCHALTANADVQDWWSGLFGPDRILDPERYYIVCPNILGSCYGTTGPDGFEGDSEQNFPLITVRDMANMHRLLADYLEISKIHLLIGGSLGGQQAMEWAIEEPDRIENLVLLATNARHSPWGIALNEAQRMAIEAGGVAGLEAARAIAMLSYRTYDQYCLTQQEADTEKLGDFRAAGYQRHQGKKLSARFSAASYAALSRAMDSHNVGRGRKSIAKALSQIKAKTQVIGISTDILFPSQEQEELAALIPEAALSIIPSAFGHDGFLTECEAINRILAAAF